jgi:hypothetical protein
VVEDDDLLMARQSLASSSRDANLFSPYCGHTSILPTNRTEVYGF